MAVWQFKVELTPGARLSAGLDLATLFPDDSFDGSAAWGGYSDAEALEQEIDWFDAKVDSGDPEHLRL